MDKTSVYTSITYGVLAILVGIVSFTFTGDVTAFVAGAVTGLLVLVALLVGSRVDANTGYLFIAAVSLVFGAYSGMNFALNNRFLPSGIMTVLSATTIVVVGICWLNSKKKVKVEVKR